MAAPLTVRQLEYIVAVADTLGFHRAAELCHVSQPTLSAQVQEIEHALGVKLFERDRRRVLVTSVGAEIVQRARGILVDVDDLVATARRARDPLTGALRIGVIPTVAPYLLADIAPAIRVAHPSLRLSLREEKTSEVLRDLKEGRLDAGLLALEADGVEAFDHASVEEDVFVLAVPPGHPLSKVKRVRLQDLEDEQVLLLDDGHCFRSQALALCKQAGVREADLRATSLATMVQMVSSGAGITLLPSLAVPVENRRGQLAIRPFAAPAPSRTIALVWRRESPLKKPLETLAATMRRARKGTIAEAPAGDVRTRSTPGGKWASKAP